MEYNCPEQSSIMRNAISSLCMGWDALSWTASYHRRETRAFTIFKFRIQLRCKVESAQSPSKIKTNVFVGFRFRFEPLFFTFPISCLIQRILEGVRCLASKEQNGYGFPEEGPLLFMIKDRKKHAGCMQERVNVTRHVCTTSSAVHQLLWFLCSC